MDQVNFKTENKYVVEILQEIKQGFGRDVLIRYGDMSIGANETLMSNVDNNIPTIIIKRGYNFSEEEIYHELFHLFIKLKNGINGVEIEGNLFNFIKNCVKNQNIVLSKAHSILHHSYFFEKMMKNGFNPGKYVEDQLHARFNEYVDIYAEDKNIHNSLDIWHIALSLNNGKLRSDYFLNNLKILISVDVYNSGMKLLELSEKFISPEKESEIFINIIKELLQYDNEIRCFRRSNSMIYA